MNERHRPDASLPRLTHGVSIAWVFRAILFIALLVIFGLGVRLDRYFGPTPYHFCGLLAATCLVLVLHPLLITGCFVLSRRWRADLAVEHRLSLAETLKMVDREIDASARGMVWANPFRGQLPAPAPQGRTRHHAVLFLHGYFCNRSVWQKAMTRMASHGYRVEALTLEPAFGSIEEADASIGAAIDRLLAEGDQEQVVLVGHSMGGLSARYYLEHSGDSRVSRLICLGSPHHGTVMARAGHAKNTRQIRRGSDWLDRLNASSRFARKNIVNLYSVHDSIVFPSSTCHLEGAENQVLSGIGHVSLLYHQTTHDAILALLDRLEANLVQPAATAGTAMP